MSDRLHWGWLGGYVPTRAAVYAWTLPCALSALSLVNPSLFWAAISLDLALVLLFCMDALRLRQVELGLERELPHIWSAGRPERVHIRIHNPLRYALDIELEQSLFSEARDEGLPLRLRVPGQGMAEGSYRVMSARRGRYRVGPQHLRYSSPWGFWQRQVDVMGEEEVQVWPDVKALAEYDLLARSNRQGLLTRTSRRPGSESEFDRLRPYQHGDEYRLVDWKATARSGTREGQPVVRQLRQATDQNLIFLLDCGRTMTAETDGRSALDYALDALLLVSHVAARKGDKAGLIAFDQKIRAWLPPTGGPSSSRTLLRTVCDLHPTLEEPDYAEAFSLLRARVKRRCLVMLFSNVVDESTANLLEKLFATAHRHLLVWVNMRDPGVEAMLEAAPDRPEAPWERGAAAEVLVWRRRVLEKAEAHGVLVLDVVPQQFTPALLDRYLDIKARQLL